MIRELAPAARVNVEELPVLRATPATQATPNQKDRVAGRVSQTWDNSQAPSHVPELADKQRKQKIFLP